MTASVLGVTSPRAWPLGAVLCTALLACGPAQDPTRPLYPQPPSEPEESQPDGGRETAPPADASTPSSIEADAGADAGTGVVDEPDTGPGDAGCAQDPSFDCGAYTFTYTPLKGIKVSVGQGHATAPGVAIPKVSGLGTKDCAEGMRTITRSSGIGMSEGESDAEAVLERVNLRKQAELDPAVEAFAARITPTEVTRSFELYTGRDGSSEQLRYSSGPDPNGQCGDTYVWFTRTTLVLDVIVTFRFPDVAARQRFASHSVQQVMSTFAQPDLQAAAEAALAESRAQVELHVAASGESHDSMREILQRSGCRGDSPAQCRATIAELRKLAGEMAERDDWTTHEFRTRPYEP